MATELNLRDLISPALRSALDRMKDKGPILKMAAEACIGIAEQSFHNPSYRLSPWPGLKTATVERKKKLDQSPKILIAEGLLLKSFVAEEPTSSRINFGVDGSKLEDSDREYANAQNFGYKAIPARPFIPISSNGNVLPAAEKAMKEAMEARLKSMLPS